MIKKISLFSLTIFSFCFLSHAAFKPEFKNGVSLKSININLDDTFIAYKANSTPVIDGHGNEDYWTNATWYPLNFVWLPYNAAVTATDFTGRFKISWTDDRLLLLVEIVDDSLYDNHVDAFDNYWNDDCVEVFVDEDHSGGDYQNTFKAFAYHVGINFDVVDPWSNDLLNDHIQGARTRQDSLYTWELSIALYKDTYNPSGSNTPATLTNNKEIGFSLAYCDNDKSPNRENFIGSKYLPQAHSNDSYINASYFGKLFFIDPNATSSLNNHSTDSKLIDFYPNPSNGTLYYNINKNLTEDCKYLVWNADGEVVLSGIIDKNKLKGSLDLKAVRNGIYFIELKNCDLILNKEIVIF